MPEILPLDEAVEATSAKTPIGSTLRCADWERVGADWNFDAVPVPELVVFCYWEFARESAFIRE